MTDKTERTWASKRAGFTKLASESYVRLDAVDYICVEERELHLRTGVRIKLPLMEDVVSVLKALGVEG